MSDFNKIMEFLDGELEQSEERSLFMDLAGNDTLRSQMKQAYNVNYSLNRNKTYFAPSTQATLGVFDSLGFRGKYLDSGATATNAKSSLLLNKSAFLGAIVAFLLTSAGFLTFNSLTTDPGNINSYSALQEPLGILAAGTGKDSGSGAVTNNGNPVQKQEVKYVYIIKDNDKHQDTQPLDRTVAENSTESLRPEPSLTERHNSEPADSTPEQDGTQPVAKLEPPLPLPTEKEIVTDAARGKDVYSISVEYRGAYYKSSRAATIEPKRQAHFDNSALTISYILDDNFEIGADIRQERFFQEYKGLNKNEIPSTFQQQPNFTTWNAMLRYKPFKFYGFTPFVQLETGLAVSKANIRGWTQRIAAGLGYNVSGPLDFVIMYEYSNLRFNNNGNNYPSEKTGILYGLNLKF